MKALSLDPAAAAGTAISGFVAFVGAIGWLWRVRNVAMNARDDLKAHVAAYDKDQAARAREHRGFEDRLRASEETAGAVRALAEAVRHSAELTGARIEALGDRFDEHAEFTKDQLVEIKDEQRRVRDQLSGTTSRNRRSN